MTRGGRFDTLAAVGRLAPSINIVEGIPMDRFLTHLPVADGCEIRQRAKMKRARHARIDPIEQERAESFGERIGTDLVG